LKEKVKPYSNPNLDATQLLNCIYENNLLGWRIKQNRHHTIINAIKNNLNIYVFLTTLCIWTVLYETLGEIFMNAFITLTSATYEKKKIFIIYEIIICDYYYLFAFLLYLSI